MNDHEHRLGAKSEEEPSRDYAPMVVFVGGLIALIVAGYFAVGSLSRGDISMADPLQSVSEWVKGLEEYGKEILDGFTLGPKLPSDPVQQAKARIVIGRQLHNKNRLDEALAELEKAAKLDPANAEAFYWIGRVHIKAERYEEAMEDFKRAAKLKPDYSEAYDNLGWLNVRLRKADEAISYLSKSIELKQNNAWAYFTRGRLFYQKGDVARALEDVKKACDLGHKEACKLHESYMEKGKSGT